MSKLIEQLKARYRDSLNVSEQRTIARGLWVLLPVLAYVLLWQPAHQALPELHASLSRLRTQASQMQLLAEQVPSLRQQAQLSELDSDALKAVVASSARQAGLPLRVISGERNSVRISADNLPFSRWLQWQRALNKTQHIRVFSAMLVATPQAGMIKLQATLTNGAEQQ